MKKILNFLNNEPGLNIEYSGAKIDGISASLLLKMENLQLDYPEVMERGEDITENLKTIKDIPHEIKSKVFQKKEIQEEVFIQTVILKI